MSGKVIIGVVDRRVFFTFRRHFPWLCLLFFGRTRGERRRPVARGGVTGLSESLAKHICDERGGLEVPGREVAAESREAF